MTRQVPKEARVLSLDRSTVQRIFAVVSFRRRPLLEKEVILMQMAAEVHRTVKNTGDLDKISVNSK